MTRLTLWVMDAYDRLVLLSSQEERLMHWNLMWVYHNTKLRTFVIKQAVKGVIQYVVRREKKGKCRKKRYETATQACAAKSYHMCRIHSE